MWLTYIGGSAKEMSISLGLYDIKHSKIRLTL